MRFNSMTGGELAHALASQIVAQLPPAVAAARGIQTADHRARHLASFLDNWRAELAHGSPAAVTPTRLATAIGVLVACCDITIEPSGDRPGIHLRGPATEALNTTMLLAHVFDHARGTRVVEDTMALLLADAAQRAFDGASSGSREASMP